MSFNKPTPKEVIALHNDGLETLRNFVELVSNPQPLIDAHKAARAETTLTEEQEQSYKKALQIIEDASQIETALQAREKAIEEDEAAHVGQVESFRSWKSEHENLLSSREEELKDFEHTLNEREIKMAADMAYNMAEYSRLISPIHDLVAQNQIDKTANEKEALRLKKLGDKLKKKSTKVREALESDDEEEPA